MRRLAIVLVLVWLYGRVYAAFQGISVRDKRSVILHFDIRDHRLVIAFDIRESRLVSAFDIQGRRLVHGRRSIAARHCEHVPRTYLSDSAVSLLVPLRSSKSKRQNALFVQCFAASRFTHTRRLAVVRCTRLTFKHYVLIVPRCVRRNTSYTDAPRHPWIDLFSRTAVVPSPPSTSLALTRPLAMFLLPVPLLLLAIVGMPVLTRLTISIRSPRHPAEPLLLHLRGAHR